MTAQPACGEAYVLSESRSPASGLPAAGRAAGAP